MADTLTRCCGQVADMMARHTKERRRHHLVVDRAAAGMALPDSGRWVAGHLVAVSYTHLTLPTNREV